MESTSSNTNNYNFYHDQHRQQQMLLQQQYNKLQNINNNHRHHQQQQLRIKCIVLGSAGAGKTSFLRRYMNGIFEKGYRKSTLGADYYTKVISNKWYNNSISISSRSDANEDESCNLQHRIDHKKEKKKKKKVDKKTKKYYDKSHSNFDTVVSLNKDDNNNHRCNDVITESTTTTDTTNCSSMISISSSTTVSTTTKSTKSKKSTRDKKSHHHRHSYSYKQRSNYNPISQYTHIALQIWDTAGKERFIPSSAIKNTTKHKNEKKKKKTKKEEMTLSSSTTISSSLTSRFGDSFFNHADVAILIYDATSSTSFLQLIQWYSELLDRINNNNSNNDINNVRNNSNNEHLKKQKKKNFPVLVVATKLDQLKEAESMKLARHKNVPQRDVLGLKGKQYKGQDYHYEYTTAFKYDKNEDNSRNNSRINMNKDNRKAQDDSNILHSSAKDVKYYIKDGNVPLSYGLESGTWTSDKEYQEYLKVAEDSCFPDRYMVKLWCKRNGLKHIEVSAMDGMGVQEAVDTMIEMALNSVNQSMISCSNGVSGETESLVDNIEGPVDFHERYGSKEGDFCNFCKWLIGRR